MFTYRVSKLFILDSSIGIGPFRLFDERFLHKKKNVIQKIEKIKNKLFDCLEGNTYR